MKNKALFLLLIFSASLLPLNIVYAEAVPQRTLYDALNLMYVSDALLLDVDFPEEVLYFPGLLSPSLDNPAVDPDNAALAAALHALKAMRNDLDAKCNLLVALFQGLEKDCEAEKVKSTCAEQKQKINAEIGKLHDLRGDRRRGPTKIWHWLKRSGRGFWYRIGPVGRRFLRQVGPEAIQMVATGGMSGSVLRNLLKQTARSMGRNRIREIVFKGVERLLQGQIDLAREAGVDICEEKEEEVKSSKVENTEEISHEEVLKFSLSSEEIDFSWIGLLDPPDDNNFYDCGSLYPDEDDLFEQTTIDIQIDPANKTLSSETIQGFRIIEHVFEWRSSLQHQSYVLKIDGPYEVEEEIENVLLLLKGNAKLSMTLNGSRKCHYWENPESGDLVSRYITIDRNQTIDFNTPYEVRIVTYDGKTGELYLTIGNELESWDKNYGLLIRTLGHTISTEEMQTIWPE